MLNYDIESPNDINHVADWVELYIAYSKESISKADLSSYIEGAHGIEPSEDLINSIWTELEERGRLYGENSPIKVDRRIVEPNFDWVDFPHYMAFLIYSLEGNPYVTSETTANAGGKLFERLSLVAIKEYMNGEAVIYGFPKEQSIQEIAENLLHERFNYTPPSYRKDRNLDIIAWKPFEDSRNSQIILLIQCASGRNWRSKLNELSLTAWSTYINFAAVPIRGFCAPISISDRERLRELSFDSGVFFDRTRLFKYSSKVPSDLRQEALEWCNLRLKEMIV